MFHLLIAFKGWRDGGGVIPEKRIYIAPGTSHGDAFLTNGKIDSAKVARFPALLVTESQGDDSKIAKVAYITEVIQGGTDTRIHYTVLKDVPAISNGALMEHLGLDRFALNHTCWKVNDADLFRILLSIEYKRAYVPKYFKADLDRQDQLISVMMPFNVEFKPTYNALKKVAKKTGFECKRADNIWEEHAVLQDIINLITRARIVVCDCTGRNPNVFYEIGIAHAFGKDVILITQSKEDIPFDLQHLRYLVYTTTRKGLADLSAGLETRILELMSVNSR